MKLYEVDCFAKDTPWVELDTANISLCLKACHRVGHIGAPQLHSGIVAPASDQLCVNQVEVDAPATLLVFLPHRALRVCSRVPDYHSPLVIAARQRALVEAAPGDAGDLTGADHLRAGIVDVHHVLQHNIVVVDFDPLGDTSNGKELLVLVEFDAGHY